MHLQIMMPTAMNDRVVLRRNLVCLFAWDIQTWGSISKEVLSESQIMGW